MWTRPAYGGGSLSDLLPSVLSCLGAPGQVDRLGLAPALGAARRIAILLVDGLGWHNLAALGTPTPEHACPTMSAIATGGLGAARPLTTGFPSTTPTSLVSLGTGVPPGEHGVLGFTVAVPGTDSVLAHIHWPDSPDPASWQPVPVLFDAATRAGITNTVVNRPQFLTSNLTRVSMGVGGNRAASDHRELAKGMLAALASSPAPAVVFGYHPDLDQAGHRFGVGSQEWWRAASELDELVETLIEGLDYGSALVITADHGQLDVPKDRRFDLGADARLSAGLRLVAGEPRVRYLHTVTGATADVADAWQAVLGAAASILTREQAIDEGLFGPVPDRHRERIGDLVVVCADDWAVLATGHEPPQVAHLVAMHGALTEAEMLVPLVVVAE